MNDFLGIGRKNFVCESVSHILRKTNHITEAFRTGGRKGDFFESIIDGFVEYKLEKDADVRGNAGSFVHGNGIDGAVEEVIEKKADVKKGK